MIDDGSYLTIEPRLFRWLSTKSYGCDSIMDLGAGKFDKLQYLRAKTKIGVERFLPYIEEYGRPGIMAVCEDMRELDKVFDAVGVESVDCIIMSDSLEHISKDDGTALIKKCFGRTKRVLVFTPHGFRHQDGDDGNPYQTHLSGWTPDELTALGFRVKVDEDFHQVGEGAIFAMWNR